MALAPSAVLTGGLLVLGVLKGGWGLIAPYALTYAAISLGTERHRRVVLTDAGISIRNVRTVFVPWPHIDGIGLNVSRWTSGSIWVYDVVANKSYRLHVPTAFWGMGYPAVQRAHDLVRDRWLAHRDGPRPPVEQWAPRPSGG